jgi:hypothetical protein
VLHVLQEQAPEGGEHRGDPRDVQRKGVDAVTKSRPALTSRWRGARKEKAEYGEQNERIGNKREHRVSGVDDLRGRDNGHTLSRRGVRPSP